MDSNPVTDIETMEVVDEEPGLLTPEEVTRLLNAAGLELQPLVAIGAFAGVRSAERLRLKWSDVDLNRGFINIPAKKAKSAKRRLIKMEANLIAWLTSFTGKAGLIWEWDGNTVARTNAFYYAMTELKEAAGVKMPQNTLRHSFASHHLAKYCDAPRLALDLGHPDADLIFNTYRELVYPDQAERYFAILPPAQAGNIMERARASA
jgi:integrase